MFRSRSTLDSAARSDARHQAEITSWWRDWHRWLRAQLQLLEARQAETTTPPSFERSDGAWEQQRADAEQTLRRIPHDRRAVFERTRERCRTETEAQLNQRANGTTPQALDPDTVERETLTRLLAQAEGSSDGVEQWGTVPLPTGWYELQVDALLRAPVAAEYTVMPDEGDARSTRIALIAGLILLGCVMVWWTWPRGAAHALPATDVLVNGQAIERWPIRSVTVIDGADARMTFPVSAADDLAVSRRRMDEQQAWWSMSALRPLQLCLPVTVLEKAQALELRGGTDVPVRRYSFQPATAREPDLLVHPCGTDATSAPRSAVLESTTTLADQPLDAPVTLSTTGPALTVQMVEVLGPGQDPQMPDDKYRVVVRVQAPASIDWTALAPRLVLRTGLELLPSDPVALRAGSDVVEVSYLAPAWPAPMEAVWSITEQETDAELRWRVTLAPPRSRAEMLRTALDMTVTGEQGHAPGSATVHLRLRNTSTIPIVLLNADLVVTQEDRAIPVTVVATAGLTISPLEARALDLPLEGVDLTRDVSVRIGAAGFRLRFEKEGGTASTETGS